MCNVLGHLHHNTEGGELVIEKNFELFSDFGKKMVECCSLRCSWVHWSHRQAKKTIYLVQKIFTFNIMTQFYLNFITWNITFPLSSDIWWGRAGWGGKSPLAYEQGILRICYKIVYTIQIWTWGLGMLQGCEWLSCYRTGWGDGYDATPEHAQPVATN